MTPTILTAKEFSARVLTFLGKRTIARLNALDRTSSDRLEQVLAEISRYARYNEPDGIPIAYRETAYGIAWAINSGRVNGATHVALKALSVADLVKIVYQVHSKCAVMSEIPSYLMSLNLRPAKC